MPRQSLLLEDSYCQPEDASPEQNLVAAILARAVADAQATFSIHKIDAVRWLQCSPELGFFADVLGLDVDYLRQQLLIEAGLSNATPRLGTRREPVPRHEGLYSAEWPSVRRKRHARVVKYKKRNVQYLRQTEDEIGRLNHLPK